MTRDPVMPNTTRQPQLELSSRAGLATRLSMAFKIAIAMLLALTPLTAVLTLGWLIRLMRRETAISIYTLTRNSTRGAAISALANTDELSGLARFPGWWTGIQGTILDGMRATIALAAATLPFGLLMMLAWWAGWENSFNKGYEQAWVGPLLTAAATTVAVIVLSYLSMALAHHAAEGSVGAIWQFALVHRLIRRLKWRYLFLTLATLGLAVPLFLSRLLPTFVETIRPDIAAQGADAIAALGMRWHVGATIYLVTILFVLRRWAARLYARAVLLEQPAQAAFSRKVAAAFGSSATRRAPSKQSRIGGILASLALCAIWLVFVATIYVGQFVNHAWWNWINHPLTGLPWMFKVF